MAEGETSGKTKDDRSLFRRATDRLGLTKKQAKTQDTNVIEMTPMRAAEGAEGAEGASGSQEDSPSSPNVPGSSGVTIPKLVGDGGGPNIPEGLNEIEMPSMDDIGVYISYLIFTIFFLIFISLTQLLGTYKAYVKYGRVIAGSMLIYTKPPPNKLNSVWVLAKEVYRPPVQDEIGDWRSRSDSDAPQMSRNKSAIRHIGLIVSDLAIATHKTIRAIWGMILHVFCHLFLGTEEYEYKESNMQLPEWVCYFVSGPLIVSGFAYYQDQSNKTTIIAAFRGLTLSFLLIVWEGMNIYYEFRWIFAIAFKKF